MPQDLTSPSISDRLLVALRTIIREELPMLTYLGIWDYVITAVGNGTVDCDPGVDTSIPLPSLTKVPIRPSVDGITVLLPPTAIGKHCIIGFINADPSRPVCLSIDAYEFAAPSPVTGAIARVGDTLVAGAFSGTILTGSGSISKT